MLCPKKCGVNRVKNKIGFCRIGLNPIIYSYFKHYGEEPPISGTKGSGTIFFSGCNMSCVYCQNHKFSQTRKGKETNSRDFAGIMLELQDKGCHNINLVTPTHIVPQILKALHRAVSKGLKIPLVYNTSAYDLSDTLKLLDGIVDIYLPDIRYDDSDTAVRYSNANDYPKYNRAAIKEMQRQVGTAKIDEQGIMIKGIIIRHLVLPNNISGTEKVMRFIATRISRESYISLMGQYIALHKAAQFKELSRRINRREYSYAKKMMDKYGLYNGWVQELKVSDDFAGTNIKAVQF